MAVTLLGSAFAPDPNMEKQLKVIQKEKMLSKMRKNQVILLNLEHCLNKRLFLAVASTGWRNTLSYD
jgi:hypothetical protein